MDGPNARCGVFPEVRRRRRPGGLHNDGSVRNTEHNQNIRDPVPHVEGQIRVLRRPRRLEFGERRQVTRACETFRQDRTEGLFRADDQLLHFKHPDHRGLSAVPHAADG